MLYYVICAVDEDTQVCTATIVLGDIVDFA